MVGHGAERDASIDTTTLRMISPLLPFHRCEINIVLLYWPKVISDSETQDKNVPSTSVLFSSPYVVKVMKEKESRRLEEVDLDTGRRRSWVETTEHDVIDLTGRTPARARTPLTSLRVNTRTNNQPDGRRTPALAEKTLKSPLLSPACILSPSEVRRYLDSRTRRSRRPSLRH